MGFALRRHPQEVKVERLSREYLRTSPEITMGHLAIFLRAKLGYGGAASDFQVKSKIGTLIFC